MTTTQIFYNNDYGFEKIRSRVKEIENNYNKLVIDGLTPLIIDCGGNIGLASRYFFETYPQSKIICIEPEHNNISQAKENNLDGNISFLEAAIGSSDTRGNIIDSQAGNNAFRVGTDENGSLEIVSINTLLNDLVDPKLRPYILKIDIEGFEKELFSKNVEWIDQFPILIIELHDWMLPRSANSCNFLKEISKLDRDFLFHGENIFSISNKSEFKDSLNSPPFLHGVP